MPAALIDPATVRRVALPVVAGIGNGLMAVPLVRQLAAGLPSAELVVVARGGAMAEPFRRTPGVARVESVGGGRAVAQALRAARADLVVLPYPSNRWQYNLLLVASGARFRLAHDYPVGGVATGRFAVRATRVPAVAGLHDVVQNLRLLPALGLAPDESELPRFALNGEDRAAANALLHDVREPFVVVHAGSARTAIGRAKRWNPRHFADLLRGLPGATGLRPVLVEGPDEAGVAANIVQHLAPADRPTVLKLAGGLGTSAALLARAALYAGTDSGLAHLAAAVGTRAVTLFAPADPARVAPAGCRDLVVQTPRACAPCMGYPLRATTPGARCKGPDWCVDAIAPARVLAKAAEAVGR